MQCEQAGEMMSARLDGQLDDVEITLLEEHMAGCNTCQVEWHRLQAIDRLLSLAPMVRAPVRVRVLVSARLSRREQARRAIFGGVALTFATAALTLLALAPILPGLLGATGIAPALIRGGPETVAQLLVFLRTVGRALVVVAGQFAVPLACLSLSSLAVALALNRLWIGAVRRLRAAH